MQKDSPSVQQNTQTQEKRNAEFLARLKGRAATKVEHPIPPIISANRNQIPRKASTDVSNNLNYIHLSPKKSDASCSIVELSQATVDPTYEHSSSRNISGQCRSSSKSNNIHQSPKKSDVCSSIGELNSKQPNKPHNSSQAIRDATYGHSSSSDDAEQRRSGSNKSSPGLAPPSIKKSNNIRLSPKKSDAGTSLGKLNSNQPHRVHTQAIRDETYEQSSSSDGAVPVQRRSGSITDTIGLALPSNQSRKISQMDEKW